MKVLSIKEPFASLIMNGMKKIETRSWKTNYRGELYIHASLSKVDKRWWDNAEFIKFIEKVKLNHGYIICKCKLVDCIYMDREYVKTLKEENFEEYLCGLYEVGRYAWVLDEVEVLDEFIEAKGHLGIWNYNN